MCEEQVWRGGVKRGVKMHPSPAQSQSRLSSRLQYEFLVEKRWFKAAPRRVRSRGAT